MGSAESKKRKVFSVDGQLLNALASLSRDTATPLDDLADEAFRDLLKKHKRPLTLKAALQESARTVPANDPGPKRPRVKKSSPER